MCRALSAFLLACSVLVLGGCSESPEHESVIGEAYAGPATLKLHMDVDPRSPESVTVNHGDRLLILKRRRRFIKVRTIGGAEGWTDVHQLMSAEQMAALNKLAQTAQKLPSQGAATVYEALNAHAEPNRLAPSFYRIREGETADVIARELSPRAPLDAKGALPTQTSRPKYAKTPQERPGRIPRLTMPPAPKLPENWLELSKTGPPESAQPPAEAEPPKPVPVDDWTLVRLKNGRAGWVLTGMLKMNIPDEVAQYSEGHRITSYFSMAEVIDAGQTKHDWLWTTISKSDQPYDFDSFRYFIWNTRRHRYETAHIEGGIKGFYPVEAHPAKPAGGKKEGSYPSFSLRIEDQGGARWRKTYVCKNYRVVLVHKERIEPHPATAPPGHPRSLSALAPESPLARPSFYARLKQRVRGWFGRK